MTRWRHEHSILVGGLVTAVLVRQDLLWLLSAAFIAGVLVGRFAHTLLVAAQWLGRRWRSSRVEDLRPRARYTVGGMDRRW